MQALLFSTFLWAFSFSLIGVYLSGQVDSYFMVFFRALMAAVVFLPFLKTRITLSQAWKYLLLGSIQLGLMYVFMFQAYLYLTVTEFLLFTVFTPIYVTLIYDLLQQRLPRKGYLLSAILAVIGAAIIRYENLSSDFWIGFFLVQAANICMAIGQVGYKFLMEKEPIPQRTAMAWFYLGATFIGLCAFLSLGNLTKLPTTTLQWGILIWLGAGASGLGYFIWNYGATQVDAGTLAVMNNVLIPAGLLVNWLIWQQTPNLLQFFIGSIVIILALVIHRYVMKQNTVV